MRKHLSETTGLQRLVYGGAAGAAAAAALPWQFDGIAGQAAGLALSINVVAGAMQ